MNERLYYELRETEARLRLVEHKLHKLQVEQSLLYQKRTRIMHDLRNEQLHLFD